MKKTPQNYPQALLRQAGINSLGDKTDQMSPIEVNKAGAKRIVRKAGEIAVLSVFAVGAANQAVHAAGQSVEDRNNYINSITPEVDVSSSIADIPDANGERPAPTDIPVFDASEGTVRIVVATNPQ